MRSSSNNATGNIRANFVQERVHNTKLPRNGGPVFGLCNCMFYYRIAPTFRGPNFRESGIDVRVFNPFAQSYRDTSLSQYYRRNEMEKERAYDERVREIEHGSFSPFSTSGGMATTATVVYKRIASMIAVKHNKPYSKTIHWIQCRLNFSLLRSAFMCIRGSRSAQLVLPSPPTPAPWTSPVLRAGSQDQAKTKHQHGTIINVTYNAQVLSISLFITLKKKKRNETN